MKRLVPFAEFDPSGLDVPDEGETINWSGRKWKVLKVDEQRKTVQLED